MKEELLVPLVGAVVVALIAGGISLVLAVLAKDQKTSEFRQAWIDALRDDVSKLTGHVTTVTHQLRVINKEDREEIRSFFFSRHAEFIEISTIVSRIRLRLNKGEHTKLISLVSELDSLADNTAAFEFRVEAVIAEAQDILKSEWNRVKRGEPSYRILKGVSGSALLCSVVGAVWLFMDHYFH